MSRIPLIAGNWKMHKTVAEAESLVRDLAPRVEGLEKVEVAVCPPATALHVVGQALAGSVVELGAQDVFWAEQGAFTGMISPVMLKEVGCKYAIVGHSERRGRFGKPDESLGEAARVFGDTDASVNLKVKAALRHELVPIMCVGEMLAERDAGRTDAVVTRQVEMGLEGVSAEQAAGIVIAYEPVWAIGTGRACGAEEANRVIGLIRKTIRGKFGEEVGDRIRIQYGGSVTDKNAHELLSQPELDGALVGGASLEVCRFALIVQAASVIAKEVSK
jgi:triosephosphate isomerase